MQPSGSPTGGPPMDPSVLMQQMPPLSQFSGQGAEMLSGGEDPMAADPTAFAKSELDQIAAKLMNVAKVLSQNKKELMPLVQKMAEAGSMLSNELQANNAPQDLGAEQVPGGAPQGQGPGDVGLGA